MYWDVTIVQPLKNYRIYVELENGQRGIFDLKPYLDQGTFRELQNVYYFNQVDILFGAVTWPHEQDIAPDTLMAGLVPLDKAEDLTELTETEGKTTIEEMVDHPVVKPLVAAVKGFMDA